VQLDARKQEEALLQFDRALQLGPQSVDALLHRSNLRNAGPCFLAIRSNFTTEAVPTRRRFFRSKHHGAPMCALHFGHLIEVPDGIGADNKIQIK
jgi:hypothetical protein